MFARFFEHDGSFRLLFATQNIISYDYTKRWVQAGDFTLVLPYKVQHLKKLKLNTFIECDNDWLMIENIRYDMQRITLSGHDVKQLLYLRITAFGETQDVGTDGYDAVSGTTAECIKHFLDNNLISPADNIRKLPVSWKNGAVGLSDDGYMARLENVGEIVEKLCNSAGIGYEVEGRLSHNDFVIQTKKTVDKSKNQSINPRVIFSAERGNVTSLEFEHDESNLCNAIIAAGADTLRIVYRDNNNIPQGLSRRECITDVTVDSVSDISKYALYAVEGNVDTHTYTIGVSVNDYGSKFDIGDIVTVRDDALYNDFSAVITEVHISRSAGREKVDITLGKQKTKLINKIVNNLLNGTIRKG